MAQDETDNGAAEGAADRVASNGACAAAPEAAAGLMLRRLYDDNHQALLRYLRRRLADPQEADDAAQDLYCRIAARDARAIREPRAYLFEAARKLLVSRRRRARARPGETGGVDAEALVCPAPSPERRAEARARLAATLAAIDALSPKCRAVFVMVRLEERSYREAAAALGISVKLVEYYMRQALLSLLADAERRAGTEQREAAE